MQLYGLETAVYLCYIYRGSSKFKFSVLNLADRILQRVLNLVPYLNLEGTKFNLNLVTGMRSRTVRVVLYDLLSVAVG